ncbi:GNAT family N-acetyltransferase [Paenibacillus sp. strain BS8-2]
MEQKVRIDRLGPDRFDESMELSQFAFQYIRSKQELEETKKKLEDEPADRWVVLVDDKLAAQAGVLELQTYIGGKAYATGGLAGVATWPEYRRQGFVGQLLLHSLEAMKEKGQTVSFLHPFAFGFYRKFGWETYTEYKKYTLQSHQLPPRIVSPGRIERVSDYSLLYDVYETFASRYNGTLKRDEKWWKYRINVQMPTKMVIYRDAAGIVQGYLIYKVAQKELNVRELIHLNDDARAALWSFIAQHDSMIETVTLNAPIDDHLTDHLIDLRIKQEIVPYFMARIVDLQAFIKDYPFLPGAESLTLSIHVTDEQAAWNHGTFLLRIEESGQASVVQQSDGNTSENDADNEITIGIGALTMLLMSYRSGLQLSGSGRIKGSSKLINRLQARIPERTTYLPDFF